MRRRARRFVRSLIRRRVRWRRRDQGRVRRRRVRQRPGRWTCCFLRNRKAWSAAGRLEISFHPQIRKKGQNGTAEAKSLQRPPRVARRLRHCGLPSAPFTTRTREPGHRRLAAWRVHETYIAVRRLRPAALHSDVEGSVRVFLLPRAEEPSRTDGLPLGVRRRGRHRAAGRGPVPPHPAVTSRHRASHRRFSQHGRAGERAGATSNVGCTGGRSTPRAELHRWRPAP